MTLDRIPDLTADTLEGAALWFALMHTAGLAFHPEDAPEEIIHLRNGAPIFTDAECEKVRGIVARINEINADPCAMLRRVMDVLDHITSRDTHPAGPVVWANRNPDEARELEEFAADYPETFARIGG